MAGIAHLQLPDYRAAPQIDWSPLNQIGQAIGEARKQSDIKDAFSEAMVDGKPDLQLAIAGLVKRGRTDEARSLINTLATQGNLAVHQGALNLAQQKYFNERADEAARQARERQLLQGLPQLPGEATPVGPQSSLPGGVTAIGPEAGVATPASVYSQYTGNSTWVDRQDRPNSNALGVPDEKQGIALPTRDTLGQWFDVTAPNGQTYRLQQTDVGPARWTGKGIDISAAAADKMGYAPNTFPTGARFAYKPAAGPPEATPIASAPPQGVQVAQAYGTPVAGTAEATPAPQSDVDKAIAQYQKILESPDLSDNARKAIQARVTRLMTAQERNPANIEAAAKAKTAGQEAAKKEANFPQALKATQITSHNWDMVLNAVNELGLGGPEQQARLNSATDRRTGAISRNNPFGEGWTWADRLASLKNKLAINAIQAMREQSKTGGAAGNMTEKEWPIFMEMVDSLDPNMGPVEFAKSLRNIRAHAQRLKSVSQDAFYRDYPKARSDETIDLNPPISNEPQGQTQGPPAGERTTKSGVKWSF